MKGYTTMMEDLDMYEELDSETQEKIMDSVIITFFRSEATL